MENRRFYLNNELLELTAKEYNLLALFMKRPGKVFTKQEIYEFLWEEPYYNDDNTIMVHISKLREKIEDNPRDPKKINTVRGIGYMMNTLYFMNKVCGLPTAKTQNQKHKKETLSLKFSFTFLNF